MYSEETIEILTNRIGFGLAKEEGFSIDITEANSVGESGRVFSSFHALVTVENIFACIPDLIGENEQAKEDSFNVILNDYRKQSVLEILPIILDNNENYSSENAYDNVIIDNIHLFDRAIGYKTAINILEVFMTTKESNVAERNAKLSISNLKVELEGIKNENGVRMTLGIRQHFNQAVKDGVKKIFPVKATVSSKKVW